MKFIKGILVTSILSFATASLAFADDTNNLNSSTTTDNTANPALTNTTTTINDQTNTTANTTSNKTSPKDAEIIAYIIAVDNAEIKGADAAVSKQPSDNVAQLANLIKTDHTQNLNDAQNLSQKTNIQPNDTKTVQQFKDKTDKSLNKISSYNGNQFEKEYINGMIKGHDEVLIVLTKFSKQTQNPDVKQFVNNTKDSVKKHLEVAKRVKSEIQNGNKTSTSSNVNTIPPTSSVE